MEVRDRERRREDRRKRGGETTRTWQKIATHRKKNSGVSYVMSRPSGLRRGGKVGNARALPYDLKEEQHV